jgi:predicted acyltransferase
MRHFHGKSGMTFVELVFPAFLFIVGMSLPIALGLRLQKGEPLGKLLLHIVTRTLALLWIGIMMVNELPDSTAMGWSANLWSVSFYLSAIAAFCSLSPAPVQRADPTQMNRWRVLTLIVRLLGFAGLIFLAFVFQGPNGRRIITLWPFSIHTEWYGILGLIGWAYLVGAVVFLCFGTQRTALLGAMVLLLCLYAAERNGAFRNFWLAKYVGIGGALGSQGSITVAGMLLATILITPETAALRSRIRFALLFIAGCSAGALLVQGLYGINKNSATPSWCLWASAITAGVWLIFYFVCDVRPVTGISRPLALAGANVLLAYLLSEMLPSALDLTGLGEAYGRLAEYNLFSAVGRSAGCAFLILLFATTLNRIGFRLKL